MSRFSLEEFDDHISNLRSQLQFLNRNLEATDHNAPDWLATDLLSLRNKSGRLQDDMQRFQDQLESAGLGMRKASNKRLSIEGAKTSPSAKKPRNGAMSAAQRPPTSPPPSNLATSPPHPQLSQDTYAPQEIDVSEEVNRRLHQNRLRRLMDSSSTSQKRKHDVLEDTTMSSGLGTDDERDLRKDVLERGKGGRNWVDGVKRLRASGTFGGRVGTIEGLLKRKVDGGSGQGESEGGFKRRRI